MATKSGKRESNGAAKEKKPRGKLEDDVDPLFRLPLTEFIAARKTLAAQLKQDGRGSEAERVRSLVKPSISAWAVNQLYWQHRQEFDRLIATSERFRKAQTSTLAGKAAEMRAALDARRDALSDLAQMATALLNDAGHNPSLDTMRRITNTLEAMSAYASFPEDSSPGRLTQDVDPPGFESLGSFVPAAGMTAKKEKPPPIKHSPKSAGASANTRQKSASVRDKHQIEKARQARIAAAKVSVQEARRVLVKARARAQSAEAAQKKTFADAKEKEKQRREAEQRFEKAKAAAEDADRRARSLEDDVGEAAKAVEDAERAVEKAAEELDSLATED